MGFGDRFVGNEIRHVSVKVKCTGCQRVTVVKIPPGKAFDKWNEKSTCTLCGAKKCWVEFES